MSSSQLGVRQRQKLASGVLIALVLMGSSLLLTLPSSVHALTLVQTSSSSNYTTSGASANLPIQATAGDAVIVLFQAVVTGGISTPLVTDARGTSFTQSVAQGYYYSGNSYWYLNYIDCGILTTSGPESVGVSLQNLGFRIEVIEVQGVSCQNPYSSSGAADSGSSISTSTFVPFPAGGIAVASIIGNGAVTSGSSFTLLEALSGDNFVSEYSLSAPGQINFPATNGSPGQPRYGGNFWLEVGAVYQPSSSTPVVTQTVILTQTVTQTVEVIVGGATSTVTQVSTAIQLLPTVSTSTVVASITSDPIFLGFGLVIVVLLMVLIALVARRPSPHQVG